MFISLAATITTNRQKLKEALKQNDRPGAELLAGIIVGQRILNNEISLNLPPIPEHLK